MKQNIFPRKGFIPV